MCIVNGQQLKLKTGNGQSPEINTVDSETLKRAGQSLYLAVVTAVTMEFMEVTPLMYIREYPDIPIQYSHVIKRSSLISAN